MENYKFTKIASVRIHQICPFSIIIKLLSSQRTFQLNLIILIDSKA